jgi:hypothetical protein
MEKLIICNSQKCRYLLGRELMDCVNVATLRSAEQVKRVYIRNLHYSRVILQGLILFSLFLSTDSEGKLEIWSQITSNYAYGLFLRSCQAVKSVVMFNPFPKNVDNMTIILVNIYISHV